MKSSSYKTQYILRNNCNKIIVTYKATLLISIILLLIGVVLGVTTSTKYAADFGLDNMLDKGFVDFLKGDKGSMGLFFSHLLPFLFFNCFIIFLNFKPFLKVFTYILLIVKGYLVSFDYVVLFTVYGLAGVINVIVFILPFELCICAIMILVSAMALRRNNIIHKYGVCDSMDYTKAYIVLLVVGVVLLLIRSWIMPILNVTIIVV